MEDFFAIGRGKVVRVLDLIEDAQLALMRIDGVTGQTIRSAAIFQECLPMIREARTFERQPQPHVEVLRSSQCRIEQTDIEKPFASRNYPRCNQATTRFN